MLRIRPPGYLPAMRIETLAVHAGQAVDPTTGAVTAPIHLSSTFERGTDEGYVAGHVYSRTSNPNRDALETALAGLEEGAAAIAYGSGSAATLAVFQALQSGDHVLAPHDAYFGTLRQLREIFAQWGLQSDTVDMSDLDAVRRAMRPNTRVVWVETPSNPLVRVVDIAALAEIARSGGARCVVDNTWATPVLQLPLGLGADLVMHSTTKYLGGHSDLLGGALVAKANDEFTERLRLMQKLGGAIPSPFDCWLLLRGIRTLPWRMRAHCANASTVATWLAETLGPAAVHYPGLPTHPGHDIAARQMQHFGAVLSFELADKAAAEKFFASAKLVTEATSFGGTCTCAERRARWGGDAVPEGFIRLSAGIEHPDDLIADIGQALDALGIETHGR